jgi:hypothetical protein
MMVGGNPDEERGRAEDDFYPTPPEVTRALLKTLDLSRWGKIWEPCAGDAAMVDELWRQGIPEVVASDIHPRRDDIAKADFLDSVSMPPDCDAIITNPPFGSIAPKIIRHAFEIGAKRMALMLKATFWHAKNRRSLFNAHRPLYIMPLTWRPDFKNLGRPTMEAMWCVWDKAHSGYPLYIPLSKPE